MRLLALLILLLTPALAFAQPAEVRGDWKGELDTGGGGRLPLVLQLGEKVTLRTPTQGDITVEGQLTQNGEDLVVVFPANGVRIDLKAETAALRGRFSQRGLTLPIVFTRDGAQVATLVRPQTPRPPFPYRAEEVSYQGEGVRIAGTLTLPPGQGPFPAVLLITGSGAQDRDETILGHKPFMVIADALTRRGVAVLRADDRGVGGSTGNLAETTLDTLAKDVAAGVAFLRARPDIDRARVGLLGHSEGAISAPIAAAADPSIASVALIAGPSVTGAEIIIHQHRKLLEAEGLPKQAIDQANALQAVISRLVASAADDETVRAEVRKALAGQAEATIEGQAAAVTSPSYRAFMRHDPVPVLAQLKMPVLAVWGSKDLQVDPEQNAPGFRFALASNRGARIEVLPDLNHLLQTSTTGKVSEYGLIEETMAPAALALISDWVAAQAKAR